MAKRRERRADDPLGKALVADRGDVIGAETALAFRDEHIFAPVLQAVHAAIGALHDIGEFLARLGFARQAVAEDRAARPVLELASVLLDMLLVIIGIGIAVQIGPDHRLRLVPFGHAHRLEPAFEPEPAVEPDEVDEIGAEQQQLRHHRIVIIRLAEVAVGALLGLGLAHRVREVRRERLGREAGCRNRRLLHIYALAVDIGRGQDQRRGRADRGDDIALAGLVAADLEHLVTRDLRVVGRIVARLVFLVFVDLGLPVGLDRQMTATARGRPAQMAGEARHLVGIVRAVLLRDRQAEAVFACLRPVLGHQLGTRGLGVEIGAVGIDRVLDQADLPRQFGVEHRALDQHPPSGRILHPFEAALAIGIADQRQVVALGPRGEVRGEQCGVGIRRAMAVLAADLYRIGDLAIDQAVAVPVLAEVAIDALHAELGMDVHHVHRLAGIGADGHELALACLAEFLRIVGRDHVGGIGAPGRHIAFRIEQIALAVALQDRAEVPAMAVIVGKLRVLGLGIEVIDVAHEIDIGPQTARRCAFRVAIERGAHFLGGGIMLLLVDALIVFFRHALGLGRAVFRSRPQQRRVGFIIPHRVAEIAVQEDVGLVHVAIHALRGRDRAGESVLERMALFLERDRLRMTGLGAMAAAAAVGGSMRIRTFGERGAMIAAVTACLPMLLMMLGGVIVAIATGALLPLGQAVDRRVVGDRLPVAAIFGIDQAVARFAVIGIDDMARRAARGAIITRLIVGAHLPQERIVQAGLVDVQHRNRDAQAGAGAAVRLLEVGTARLFQTLDDADAVGQADFREGRVDVSAAALEHAEDVARRNNVPGRQRIHDRQRAARLLGFGHGAVRCARFGRGGLDHRRLAIAGEAFPEDVILERHDAVIIGRAAPQHRAGGHQRAFGRLDNLDMAGAAGFAHHAVIRRVDEADELGRFLGEQRIGALGVGRARPFPRHRIFGQDVALHQRVLVRQALAAPGVVAHHCGIAAMAIGAAQDHGGRGMHRLVVAGGVARLAADALGIGLGPFLVLGRGRRERVLDLLRLFLARGEQLIGGKRSEGDEQQARQQQLPVDGGHRAAQPVSTPGSH